MWTFSQSTGDVISPLGLRYTGSYAGRGEGKNNPILQDVRAGCRWDDEKQLWMPVDGLTPTDCGPLPVAIYDIGEPYDDPKHGPFTMRLTPRPGSEMFHRDGFLWHGDNKDKPGWGSEGCIASPPVVRHVVWSGSTDHAVEVVANLE